jgi:(p)ppGpp synthase/HD superfamily hydrolase
MKSSLAAALEFAQEFHGSQTWKQDKKSFLHHPLGVASLVLFYGGDSVQAQAALIHDTICEGATVHQIEAIFGSEVRSLVEAFQDPPEARNEKLEWSEIKNAYFNKIKGLEDRACFVIVCEELHELTCLNLDLKTQGAKVWERYPVPGRDLGWYYKSLLSIVYAKLSRESYRALVTEFAAQTKVLSLRVFEGIEN